MQAQRIGHPHTAHAQHDLLLQAVVGVAAVEMVGQATIPARVFLQIGVEKVDGHHVPGASFKVVAPGAHGDDPLFHRYGDPRRFFDAEIGWIPRLDDFALNSSLVDVLLEISLAVQKRESGKWNAEVSRGTQRVSRQDAKPPGIGRHQRMNGNFHGEISDLTRLRKRFVCKWFHRLRLHDYVYASGAPFKLWQPPTSSYSKAHCEGVIAVLAGVISPILASHAPRKMQLLNHGSRKECTGTAPSLSAMTAPV